MKKNLLTFLQYAVFLGLGIGLIWWQYTHLNESDKENMLTAIGQVKNRLWLLIPVLIVGFLSHLFRALRWKLLLEPLKLNPSTVNITLATLIGYLVNLLLPRMGEVARCTVLAKYEKEPVDNIVGTIVAERSFDLVCLVIVAVLTFALQAQKVSHYANEIFAGLALRGGMLAIILGSLLAVIIGLVWLYRRNKATKVGKVLKGIGDGVRSIMHLKHRALFIVYTVLIWGCYLSLIMLGFQAMEATENLGWLAGLSVLVFGSLGMIITPGGLGAYPIAVQKVLVNVYFINASFALAFGWVSWLAQTAIILLLGISAVIILPLYNRKHHAHKNRLDTQ